MGLIMGLISTWIESLYEPNIINDKCLCAISPKSNCSICMEVCPVDAVQFPSEKQRKPKINLQVCNECQRCVIECPVNAIEGFLPKRPLIDNTLILQTKDLPISVKEWLYWHKKGVRFVYSDDLNLADHLIKINRLLENLNIPVLTIATVYPSENTNGKEISRRDLFTHLGRTGQKSIVESYTPASWRKNNKLLNLNHLYSNTTFFKISVSQESCTLCGICSSLCPEKAIEFSSTKSDTFKLLHHKCTNCTLCEDVCPEYAVRISEYTTNQGLEDLFELTTNQCEICKNPFKAWHHTAKVCHICESRN